VQGVGFRPFVQKLANALSLNGFVRNEVRGVSIEIEGSSTRHFLTALREEAPALARIDSIDTETIDVRGDKCFRILSSSSSSAPERGVPIVPPDVATCDECLAELFDEANRRHHHAFITCTNCGPRLSIIEHMPYDRERTTMRSFAMCDACRAEYANAADRRHHAQPIACRQCGPRLSLSSIDAVATSLREGKIAAIKGIGGYHLACLATDERAVARLREAKHRDAKPFAVLVADIADSEAYCFVSATEKALLMSAARPIVLLEKKPSRLAESIAPGQSRLGLMLPYSPIHHLLLRAVGSVPLVMTSGNVTDEPIAFEDEDARQRLGPIVDVMLTHDRPIHHRVEDSVAQVIDESPSVMRRARGYAPLPIALPARLAKPTLALGGHLKAVFALGLNQQAFLSQHFGDLDAFEALRAYREGIARYCDLFGVEPEVVLHDLHPDYATTAIALELEKERGLARVAIQHHEAHVASCLAENNHPLDADAIGVAFDGLGYGHDGAMWGGEIFAVRPGLSFERKMHLRYAAMPGGDRAAREPWRMAVAWLADAKLDASSLFGTRAGLIEQILPQSIQTSSVGRLFDAVAAILDVRHENAYEAQAAMELQARAESVSDDEAYPFDLTSEEIDPRPLLRALIADKADVAIVAHRFHRTVAEMIAAACQRVGTPDNAVALSGGVFANALLVKLTKTSLRRAGFNRVLIHHDVPTNDGGLAFGQLAMVRQ
jgi:hydrogenase maturation protein HypF